jgi:hypothetical protein
LHSDEQDAGVFNQLTCIALHSDEQDAVVFNQSEIYQHLARRASAVSEWLWV